MFLDPIPDPERVTVLRLNVYKSRKLPLIYNSVASYNELHKCLMIVI